jgi:hypothetical protein
MNQQESITELNTIRHYCECNCRRMIRYIHLAFTRNELSSYESIPITLEVAQEKTKNLIDEYKDFGQPYGVTGCFAYHLRKKVDDPSSLMNSLETCKCCSRHQRFRHSEKCIIDGPEREQYPIPRNKVVQKFDYSTIADGDRYEHYEDYAEDEEDGEDMSDTRSWSTVDDYEQDLDVDV